MNRMLTMIMLFGGIYENAVDGAAAGGGGAAPGSAAVVNDPGTGSTGSIGVGSGTPPAPGSAPTGDGSGTQPTDGGQPPAGDDLMAQLEAAMAAQLGDQPPKPGQQQPPAGTQPADGTVPAPFQAALEISPYVTSAESVQNAVRAADEVWKVANGQAPARTMLEGFRGQATPPQFDAIIQDLAGYIQEVTGTSPVAQGQASALDQLATSHPQIFAAVQEFVRKSAGVELGGAPDPREARLSAIEQEFARQQDIQQAAAWNERVNTARTKSLEFLSTISKGTFAEGHEAYFLSMCGAKAGIPEAQMIDMILQGKTQKLEAAYRAVMKEEATRLKAYNANLIKGYRTKANGVPASGTGASAAATATANALPRNAGESDVAYATRLWEAGHK